jgi:hypothetical protein
MLPVGQHGVRKIVDEEGKRMKDLENLRIMR